MVTEEYPNYYNNRQIAEDQSSELANSFNSVNWELGLQTTREALVSEM
jgi:hypothetical protein